MKKEPLNKSLFIAVQLWNRSVCDLSKANTLVGIWDNRRFQLCKKPYEEFTEDDKTLLYKTEKLSRRNVEKRAECRKNIDTAIKGIVEALHHHE